MRHSDSLHSEGSSLLRIGKDGVIFQAGLRGGRASSSRSVHSTRLSQTLTGISDVARTIAGAAMTPIRLLRKPRRGRATRSGAALRSMRTMTMCSPSFAHASESKDQLLPAWATSSFTTVAGQGWLAGLAEPALDAGTTLAYRRVGRQGVVGSSDRDGLFEQESGAQKHDRSSSGARKAVSRCACLMAGGRSSA